MNKDHKYSIGTVLQRKYGTLKILAQTRIPINKNVPEKTCKSYDVECLICSYTFSIREGNLERGQGCPVCSRHKVMKGYNDLWTTRPDIARWLTNCDRGYQLMEYSNKSEDITCPFCGYHIGRKTISAISSTGISCPKCSDGISFPNKYMFNLLTFLEEKFETEAGYHWCVFPSFDGKNICHGRFDFLLPKRKIIIEMDGGLGHGHRLYKNSNRDIKELEYRDIQKDIIAHNHGFNVIRIKCDYYECNDRFFVCKNGIMNSDLANIFDLSNIPWDMIAEKSLESYVKTACDLYNTGMSSGEISEYMKRDMSTIIDYLHQGNDIGLCDFVPGKQKIIVGNKKPVKSLVTGEIYDSIKKMKQIEKNNSYILINKNEYQKMKKEKQIA